MAKILIVEDDKILSDAYTLILEKHGHNVQVAANGKAGLKAVNTFSPDIILLDIFMPEMDGLEFLKAYNPAEKAPDVSIVILSNTGDEKKVQKAVEMGAYKYIVKAQATPDELALLVNHLVKKDLAKTQT